jgi:hypothetical protein
MISRRQEKLYFEERALQWSAFHAEFGAMRIGDPSRNGETEPAACLRLALTQVCLVGVIKDLFAHIA